MNTITNSQLRAEDNLKLPTSWTQLCLARQTHSERQKVEKQCGSMEPVGSAFRQARLAREQESEPHRQTATPRTPRTDRHLQVPRLQLPDLPQELLQEPAQGSSSDLQGQGTQHDSVMLEDPPGEDAERWSRSLRRLARRPDLSGDDEMIPHQAVDADDADSRPPKRRSRGKMTYDPLLKQWVRSPSQPDTEPGTPRARHLPTPELENTGDATAPKNT